MSVGDLNVIQVRENLQGLHGDTRILCQAMIELSDVGDRKGPLPYQLEYALNGSFVIGSHIAREAIIVDDKSVLYKLHGPGRYAVIATNLSLGYPLMGLVDFDRRCCFNLGDPVWGVNSQLLRRFDSLIHQLDAKPHVTDESVVVLTGDANFAHVIWNQLSALRSLVKRSKNFVVVATHEPIVAISELTGLPSTQVRRVRDTELVALNDKHSRFIAVGNRLVPTTLRVEIVARCDEFARERNEQALVFCQTKRPFAITVRSRNRTARNFVLTAACIIRETLSRIPDATFLIDGHSLPADFSENSGYDYEEHRRLVAGDLATGNSIVDALSDIQGIESKILLAIGLDIRVSIACGNYVSAYFAHHGTVQHKLGWFHPVPGLVHSNPRTLALNPQKWVADQVEDGIAPRYLSEEFVEDAESQSAGRGEREESLRHENYNFRNLTELAIIVAEFFQTSHTGPVVESASAEATQTKGSSRIAELEGSFILQLMARCRKRAAALRRSTRPWRRSLQRLLPGSRGISSRD